LERYSLKGYRILVVEDSALIALDIEMTLSELGASVFIAADQASALQLLSEKRFDFAVVDLDLDGTPSTRIAQELFSENCPFVILSGSSQAHAESMFGKVDFLSKPFDMVALADLIILRAEQSMIAPQEQQQHLI
jgi:DNA-binding response OmpR family regulator